MIAALAPVDEGKLRLRAVRNKIASLPRQKFDMAGWRSIGWCGTVACIGGWTEQMFAKGKESSMEEIARLLGLSYMTDWTLFHPDTEEGWHATPAQAVRVIDHLDKTGRVVWSPWVMGPK
jgi:hypothetical protein